MRLSLSRFASVMRAAIVRQFGPESNIEIVNDFPKPHIKKVVVKVAYSGVNPVDTYIRSGKYKALPTLPYIIGRDGSGVVEEVGPSVTHVKKGDRVWFMAASSGTAAEYAVTDKVALLPESVSFAEGACIGVPYLTAYTALFLKTPLDVTNFRKKIKILIHGASGAVGTAIIQLASSNPQLFELIAGTAGSAEGEEIVKSNGATFVVNHRSSDYVDQLMKASATNGKCIIIGSRGELPFEPRSLMAKDATITGFGLSNSLDHTFPAISKAVGDFFSNGYYRPVIAHKFDLQEASKAHCIVIDPSPSIGQSVIKVVPQ